MNTQKSIGEYIYRLRSDRHMTQEELSFGICSVGTISRIENGSQVPSGSLLRLLLEKLGEPGFFSGLHYSRDFLEGRILENEILKSFENLDRDSFEKAFDSYRKNHIGDNNKCMQFAGFISYVYLESLGGISDNAEEQLTEILRISRRDYKIGFFTAGNYDRVEILILNSLALFLLSRNRIAESKEIFSELLRKLDEGREVLKDYYKAKAAILNNLALTFVCAGEHYKAKRVMDKANLYSKKEGGLVYRLKIMITRAYIDEVAGNKEDAAGLRYLIKMTFSELGKNKEDLWDSMGLFNDKKGIVVF